MLKVRKPGSPPPPKFTPSTPMLPVDVLWPLMAAALPPTLVSANRAKGALGDAVTTFSLESERGLVVPMPTLPVFATVITFVPLIGDPLITSKRLFPTRRLFPKLENTVPSDDMLWIHTFPSPVVFCQVSGAPPECARCNGPTGFVVPMPTLPVFITVSAFVPLPSGPLTTSNMLPPTRRLFPKLARTVPSDDMLWIHTLPGPEVFCQIRGAPPALARCKGPSGLVVPIPTLVPLSKIKELPSVPALSIHFASRFVVPVPVVWAVLCRGFVSCVPAPPAPLAPLALPPDAPVPDAPEPVDVSVVARAYADAGIPPKLSASAAFKAYGTLTNNTRRS